MEVTIGKERSSGSIAAIVFCGIFVCGGEGDCGDFDNIGSSGGFGSKRLFSVASGMRTAEVANSSTDCVNESTDLELLS